MNNPHEPITYTLRGNALDNLGGAFPPDVVRPELQETPVEAPVLRSYGRRGLSASDPCYVRDSWPTESAGAEQYLATMRPDTDVCDEDGNVVIPGLESTGYATWLPDPVSAPFTHAGQLLSTKVGYEVTTPLGKRYQASSVPTSMSGRIALERATDAFLAHATGDPMRLDVMRERTAKNGVDSVYEAIVKADAVAWRGKARCQVRSVAYAKVSAFIVAGDGTCEDHRGVTRVLGRKGVLNGYRMVGWKRAAPSTVKAKRAAKVNTERKGTTARKGPATTYWTASSKTVQRAWGKVDYGKVTTADAIAAALRMVRPGESVPITDEITVTVHASTVTAPDGKTFTIREFARRAALANVGAI